MSRRKPGRGVDRKGRSKKVGNFVMLREDIMKSPAWRSLSAVARCIWIEISRRYKGPDISRENEIPLSVREAAMLVNVGKTQAAEAFRELADRGFIRLAVAAGFNQKTGRRSRRWTLTHQPKNGQPPTNDWRDYDPTENVSRSTMRTQKQLEAPRADTNAMPMPIVSAKRDATTDSSRKNVRREGQSIDIYHAGGER